MVLKNERGKTCNNAYRRNKNFVTKTNEGKRDCHGARETMVDIRHLTASTRDGIAGKRCKILSMSNLIGTMEYAWLKLYTSITGYIQNNKHILGN